MLAIKVKSLLSQKLAAIYFIKELFSYLAGFYNRKTTKQTDIYANQHFHAAGQKHRNHN